MTRRACRWLAIAPAAFPMVSVHVALVVLAGLPRGPLLAQPGALATGATGAAPPPAVLEWPRLPAGAGVRAGPTGAAEPVGPREPSALRGGPTSVDSARPGVDDARRLREREEAERARARATLEQQERRVRESLTPRADAPAGQPQNCTDAGCFDGQGRFLPRAGPSLILPSGRPCLSVPGGLGC